MLDLPALVADKTRDRGRVAVGLSLLDDDPAFVDHADARTVQRYVDPDEELHGTMLQRVENPIVGSRDVDGKAPARSAHLYVFCGRHLLAAKLRRSNIDAAAGAVDEIGRALSAASVPAGRGCAFCCAPTVDLHENR